MNRNVFLITKCDANKEIKILSSRKIMESFSYWHQYEQACNKRANIGDVQNKEISKRYINNQHLYAYLKFIYIYIYSSQQNPFIAVAFSNLFNKNPMLFRMLETLQVLYWEIFALNIHYFCNIKYTCYNINDRNLGGILI